MRRLIILLGIICCIQNATGDKYIVGTGKVIKEEKQEIVKNDSLKNDTLVIVARLIEIAGNYPPNDNYDYVFIMKYRVLRVVKGSYTEKEILVGHYNPRFSRSKIKDKMDKYVDGNVEKFKEGLKHRLVLVTPIDRVWKDAIEDDYFDEEVDKYFALRTDLITDM